jgi:glycosyltransferase involved in cell wall biosynthesis
MITVSVIITTYGNPVFLTECINSAINQSFNNFEIIVVDDNNPNSKYRSYTEIILDEFLKKTNNLTYVKHEENLNGAAARNTGVNYAKGKYISFLDNDDFYLEDKLLKCVEFCERNKSNYVGAFSYCEFRRNRKIVGYQKNIKSGRFLVETLACSFPFSSGSNLFIRKETYNELNGFDENFKRHQDYEFLVRLFEKFDLLAIEEVLIIKNDENVNFLDVRGMINVKEQYLKKYNYLIKNFRIEEQHYIFCSNYISISEQALKANEYKIAFRYYYKALKKNGISFKVILRAIVLSVKSII